MKRKYSVLALCAGVTGMAILMASCQSPEKIAEQAQNTGNQGNVVVTQEVVEQKRLMIASGTHTVYASPDYAMVSFIVSAAGDTDVAAKEACAQKSAALAGLLGTMGETSTDVISVRAAYDYTKTPPVAAGMVASQKLSLKLSNVDFVRQAMVYALQYGADEACDIGFYISDGAEQHKTALNQAIENATQNALAMAEDAGVEIDTQTPVQMQMVKDGNTMTFSSQLDGVFTASSVPARIEVPSFKIDATVEVSFEIKVPEETK